MADVTIYSGIPGRNNLDRTIEHLAAHGIQARHRLLGFSFATMPPAASYEVSTGETDSERATALVEALAALGWPVSVRGWWSDG